MASEHDILQERPELVPVFHQEGPPGPEGVSLPTEIHTDRPVDDGSPLARNWTLTDLNRDHVFFATNLLFTHGFWPVDPVEDYIQEGRYPCNPFQLQLPRPVFTGCDAYDASGKKVSDVWNSTIIAVPKAEWPPLFRYLCEIAGTQSKLKVFYKTKPQIVSIVDVAAIENNPAITAVPYVPCVCFDLLGNHRSVYFAEKLRRYPWSPVPVKIRPGERELIELARKLFTGDKLPMAGTTEPTRQEAERRLRSMDPKSITVANNPSAAGAREKEIMDEMQEVGDLLKQAGIL